MSFPNININTPIGTQRPNVLDDEIRQLKQDVITSMQEISGYPNVACVVLPAWSTENRPTGTLKERLIGFNTTTGKIEVVSNGVFSNLPLVSDNADKVGGVRVTISTTAPSNPQVDKELWFDKTNKLWKLYDSNGWYSAGAVYLG